MDSNISLNRSDDQYIYPFFCLDDRQVDFLS
jgi:hypothetical protein